jgi:hypothetical protein
MAERGPYIDPSYWEPPEWDGDDSDEPYEADEDRACTEQPCKLGPSLDYCPDDMCQGLGYCPLLAVAQGESSREASNGR